jgi:hypothetical protein
MKSNNHNLRWIYFYSVVCVLVIGLVVFTKFVESNMSAIGNGQTVTINAHGVCQRVTNYNGPTVMVPWNTPTEWAWFRERAGGIGYSGCSETFWHPMGWMSPDDASLNRYCQERGYPGFTGAAVQSSCDAGSVHYWTGGGWAAHWGGNCPDSYNPGAMVTWVNCAYEGLTSTGNPYWDKCDDPVTSDCDCYYCDPGGGGD